MLRNSNEGIFSLAGRHVVGPVIHMDAIRSGVITNTTHRNDEIKMNKFSVSRVCDYPLNKGEYESRITQKCPK